MDFKFTNNVKDRTNTVFFETTLEKLHDLSNKKERENFAVYILKELARQFSQMWLRDNFEEIQKQVTPEMIAKAIALELLENNRLEINIKKN